MAGGGAGGGGARTQADRAAVKTKNRGTEKMERKWK